MVKLHSWFLWPYHTLLVKCLILASCILTLVCLLFLKVVCRHYFTCESMFLTNISKLLGILDRGIQLDGLGMKSFLTYESNVLFALRFMIDCSIVGGNWIEIPAGKYKKIVKNMSYCQLEFDCLYPLSCVNNWV